VKVGHTSVEYNVYMWHGLYMYEQAEVSYTTVVHDF